MPIKSVLAARYTRMKHGLTSHISELPAALQELLELPKLYELGDSFLAEYEKESTARIAVEPLRNDRRRETLELKTQYNLVKNLTEAFVGEEHATLLNTFIPSGRVSYIERAIHLRNALRGDGAILVQVGEQHLEELERAIHEYQEAVAAEDSTEAALDMADDEADTIAFTLAKMVHKAKLYIKAWTYDIEKPEIFSEFIVPRTMKKKTVSTTPVDDTIAVETVSTTPVAGAEATEA